MSYGSGAPTRLRGLRVHFYDGGADVRSTLTSQRGSIDDRTQDLIAEDSVRVVTVEQETLRTSRLEWDPKRQRISTEAPFRMTKGTDEVTGIGLEADPDLSHYRIERQVRATMSGGEDNRMMEMLDADTAAGR
jgi:LPS export ABC transporter protein LptC